MIPAEILNWCCDTSCIFFLSKPVEIIQVRLPASEFGMDDFPRDAPANGRPASVFSSDCSKSIAATAVKLCQIIGYLYLFITSDPLQTVGAIHDV